MDSDLCIYEDEKVTDLYPLSLTRPAFELRSGIFTLKRKIVSHFTGARVLYFVRNELQALLKEKYDAKQINQLPQRNAFFFNSRFIPNTQFESNYKENTVFYADGEIAGAYVNAKNIQNISYDPVNLFDTAQFRNFRKIEIQGIWINYIWDLVNRCAEQLAADFTFMQHGGKILGTIFPNVSILKESNVYIAPGAIIQPGVVLNAQAGPIYISDGVVIMANSILTGPIFVGKNSVIKAGARIYGGTSIGDLCKIGGEVEMAIVQGNSNKPHEGFLGHAYLGEWVNLGADSNNSNLKNNYGTIKVHVAGKEVDSKSTFAGLFMGDHSKCGINTMFNTGTTVGVMANIFGAGFTPKHIPSFTWGGIESFEKYDFDKAVATAGKAMSRRGKSLSTAEYDILRSIYEKSNTE
ncbi:MAG: hypothetical protein H6696_13270 [Deferribacteres bacterium]|nr:hypothetical protein [candidate division KSB1 bacterium]MCB9502901.1 hypothetical protein [Deferribacteres bacterium]